MPSLFGGGSNLGDAAQSAAAVQSQSAQQAAANQMALYQQAQANIKPWLTGGTAAVNQQAGLLGLPGYTAQDPTATLKATPGYQWLQGQGVQSQDLSAASKGLALSGAQQKNLASWGQNLALNNAWNPYQQSLQNLSGQGLQAGNMGGQWGMQTGQQMGQDYLMSGQAQGQGIWNSALANQNNSSGWGSLLGLGLGAAMSPFTGGTSLIGSAMSALGGLFGGGGGGTGTGGGGSTYDINQSGLFGGSNFGGSNWRF